MLRSLFIAVGGIVGLMVAWAFVQTIWRRTFLPASPGADVLAHRRGCGSCGCVAPCTGVGGGDGPEGRVSVEDAN
jgi:hypothetical protein